MKRESRLRLIWIRIIEYLNFFSGYRKIEMVPRTNREKQIIRRRIIGVIIIILFILFLIICVVNLFNNLVEIPESEISYYEKLLTGIALFSAFLAVLIPIFTTYFIVHHNRKIDYHQERLKVLPFLEVKAIKCETTKKTSEGTINQNKFIATNKGNGLAVDVVEQESDPGSSFPKNITVGNSVELEEDYNDRYIIELHFEDVFENKYVQEFEILHKDGMIDKDIMPYIKCHSPILVKRTSRLRYIQ